MYKLLATVYFFLLHFNGISQAINSEVDTLSKYAYFITALYEADSSIAPSAGSCCFFRKNGKLFLITAIHVLNGCDKNGIKEKNAPDLMWCIVNKTPTSRQMKIGIDRSFVKKSYPCEDKNRADIIALEVQLDSASSKDILSVEKFVKRKFKKINSYHFAGFPGYSFNKKIGNLFFPSPSSLKINNALVYKAYQYGITKDKATNLMWTNEIGDASLSGFSGGPVFAKEEGTERVRLMGISSAQSGQHFKDGVKFVIFVEIESALLSIK